MCLLAELGIGNSRNYYDMDGIFKDVLLFVTNMSVLPEIKHKYDADIFHTLEYIVSCLKNYKVQHY